MPSTNDRAVVCLAIGLLVLGDSACTTSFWLGEFSLSGQPGWTSGGVIRTRRSHQATLLRDGRVLVTGGLGRHRTDIDAFDPATGTWSVAGLLNAPRWRHSATLLADGRVLIYGGRGGLGPVDSAEIYDPLTGRASLGERPTVEMRTAVYDHTATRLRDGRVLIAGGGGAQSTCGATLRTWIFDPADLARDGVIRFQPRPELCLAREQHTATLLPDGTVLLVGGLDDVLRPTATVERFVPGSDRLVPAPAMLWRRARHTATTLFDGKILVTGGSGSRNLHPGIRLSCAPPPPPPSHGYRVPGPPPPPGPPSRPPPAYPPPPPPAEPYLDTVTLASAELYDPATDMWIEVAPMHLAREEHSAALLPDGRVLVSGGYVSDPRRCENGNQTGMDTAEVWDPRTNVWTMTVPMALYRVDHTSTPLPDGRVLLVGGGGGGSDKRRDPVEIWPPPGPE